MTDLKCPLCGAEINKRFVKVEDLEKLTKDAKTVPVAWLMSLIMQRSEVKTQ